jgi:hypothetical protein
VPDDVDNETLGNLFKLRSRGRELTFEPANQDFWDSLKVIGISLLDIVAVISPSKGGGAFLFVKNGAGKVTAASFSKYLDDLKRISTTTLRGGRGHKSFDAFKRAEGNASPGNELHHIVEQKGHKGLNELKFGKTNIHNTKNIIDIPGKEAGSLHKQVTGYYNSIDRTIHPTKKVREAIKDWSFKEQYDFGIKKLKDFGWDGITGLIN